MTSFFASRVLLNVMFMLVVLISLKGCRVAGMTPKKSNGASKGDDCEDFFSTLTNYSKHAIFPNQDSGTTSKPHPCILSMKRKTQTPKKKSLKGKGKSKSPKANGGIILQPNPNYDFLNQGEKYTPAIAKLENQRERCIDLVDMLPKCPDKIDILYYGWAPFGQGTSQSSTPKLLSTPPRGKTNPKRFSSRPRKFFRWNEWDKEHKTSLWANLKRAGAAVIVPLSGTKLYVKPVAEMLQNEPKSIIQRFYVEGATNDESGRGAPRFFHPGITKLPLIIVTSPTSAVAQKGDGNRSEYQRMWDEADNAFGNVFDRALEKRENVYIISCRPKMGEDDGKDYESISTTGFGWLRYCAMDIARRLNVWSAGNLKYVWFSDMNVLGFVRQKQVPVSFKYVKRRVKSLELPSSIVKQLCTLRILLRNLQEFTKVYTPNVFSVIERSPKISPIEKNIAKFIRETKDELENMIAIATSRVSSIRLFVVPDDEGAEGSELMFPKIATAGQDFPHEDPLFNSCGCKDLIPDILAEEANFDALREVFKSEPEADATATTEKDSLHKCIFEDALLQGRVVRVSLTGLAGGLKGVKYSIVAESEDMDMTDQIIQDTIDEEDVVLLTGLTGTNNGKFDGHVMLGLYSDVRVEHDLAMTKDGAAFGRLDLEVREIFEKHPGTVVVGFRADVFGRDEKNLGALRLAAKSKDTYHTHTFGKSIPLGYEQYDNEKYALQDVIRHPQTIGLLQQVTVWRMADVGSVNFPCGMTRGKEDFSLFDFLKDLHRAHESNDGRFGTLMIKLNSVSIVKLASPRDTASSPSDRMREIEAVKTWYEDHGSKVPDTSMTVESFVGDALGPITSTLQIFCDAQECDLTAEDVVRRWVRSGKMALDERAPSAEDSDMKSSTSHLRGSDDDSSEEEGGKNATARAARKSPSTGRKEDFRAVAGKIVVHVVSACLRSSGFAKERAKRGMADRGVRSRYAYKMFYSNEYAKPDYDSMPPHFLGDKQADNLALVDSELFVMLTERDAKRDAKSDAKKTEPKDVQPDEGHPSDVEAFVRAARSGEREKVAEIMDQMDDRTIKGVMDAIASDGRNPLTAAAIANQYAIVKYVLGELRVDVLKRKASDIADTLCASMPSPRLVGRLTENSAVKKSADSRRGGERLVKECTEEVKKAEKNAEKKAGTSEILHGYSTIENFCQEQVRLMQIQEGEMKRLSEAARKRRLSEAARKHKGTLKASKEVVDPPVPVTFIPATVYGPPSGYELMRVPGDGDCMYYAILEAAYNARPENGDFKKRPARKTDAEELRTKIANYFVDPESMSKCPTIQVIKELLGPNETETATGLFERRVRPYIAGSDINVGSYGGQEEQLLIECMYRQNPLPGNRSLRIEVFDGAHNEWVSRNVDENRETDVVVNLYYNGRDHYDWLRPIPDHNAFRFARDRSAPNVDSTLSQPPPTGQSFDHDFAKFRLHYETLLLMAFRRGGSECMKMVRTAYCKSEREEERGEEEVSNDEEEEEKVPDDEEEEEKVSDGQENESGSYKVDIESQIQCRCDDERISICPVYHTFPRGEDSPFPSTEEDVPPTCAEYSYNNADSQPLATYCDVSPRDTWSVGGSFESAVFFKRDESERKMTILQSAVVSGNLRLLDLIMSMSDVQDIDTLTKYDRDGDDRTSMIYAAASGSFKAVLRIHEFLKYQMSRAVGLKKYYDHVDKFGRNAMHYAADQNHMQIVNFLYRQSRDAAVQIDRYGNTPIMLAARQRKRDAWSEFTELIYADEKSGEKVIGRFLETVERAEEKNNGDGFCYKDFDGTCTRTSPQGTVSDAGHTVKRGNQQETSSQVKSPERQDDDGHFLGRHFESPIDSEGNTGNNGRRNANQAYAGHVLQPPPPLRRYLNSPLARNLKFGPDWGD